MFEHEVVIRNKPAKTRREIQLLAQEDKNKDENESDKNL